MSLFRLRLRRRQFVGARCAERRSAISARILYRIGVLVLLQGNQYFFLLGMIRVPEQRGRIGKPPPISDGHRLDYISVVINSEHHTVCHARIGSPSPLGVVKLALVVKRQAFGWMRKENCMQVRPAGLQRLNRKVTLGYGVWSAGFLGVVQSVNFLAQRRPFQRTTCLPRLLRSQMRRE